MICEPVVHLPSLESAYSMESKKRSLARGDNQTSTEQFTDPHQKRAKVAKYPSLNSSKIVLRDSSDKLAQASTLSPIHASIENRNVPSHIQEGLEDFRCCRAREMRCHPSPDIIFSVQKTITSGMRAMLVDWLAEVRDEFKFSIETLFSAVSFLDRYLSSVSVARDRFQLLGVTCLWLAAKYEEVMVPSAARIAAMTDNVYTRQEVLDQESKILDVLKFELALPSRLRFLHLYSLLVPVPSGSSPTWIASLRVLSEALLDLTLLDIRYLKVPHSVVAAASLYLACRILKAEQSLPYVAHYCDLAAAKLHELSDDLFSTLNVCWSRRESHGCAMVSNFEKWTRNYKHLGFTSGKATGLNCGSESAFKCLGRENSSNSSMNYSSGSTRHYSSGTCSSDCRTDDLSIDDSSRIRHGRTTTTFYPQASSSSSSSSASSCAPSSVFTIPAPNNNTTDASEAKASRTNACNGAIANHLRSKEIQSSKVSIPSSSFSSTASAAMASSSSTRSFSADSSRATEVRTARLSSTSTSSSFSFSLSSAYSESSLSAPATCSTTSSRPLPVSFASSSKSSLSVNLNTVIITPNSMVPTTTAMKGPCAVALPPVYGRRPSNTTYAVNPSINGNHSSTANNLNNNNNNISIALNNGGEGALREGEGVAASTIDIGTNGKAAALINNIQGEIGSSLDGSIAKISNDIHNHKDSISVSACVSRRNSSDSSSSTSSFASSSSSTSSSSTTSPLSLEASMIRSANGPMSGSNLLACATAIAAVATGTAATATAAVATNGSPTPGGGSDFITPMTRHHSTGLIALSQVYSSQAYLNQSAVQKCCSGSSSTATVHSLTDSGNKEVNKVYSDDNVDCTDHCRGIRNLHISNSHYNRSVTDNNNTSYVNGSSVSFSNGLSMRSTSDAKFSHNQLPPYAYDVALGGHVADGLSQSLAHVVHLQHHPSGQRSDDGAGRMAPIFCSSSFNGAISLAYPVVGVIDSGSRFHSSSSSSSSSSTFSSHDTCDSSASAFPSSTLSSMGFDRSSSTPLYSAAVACMPPASFAGVSFSK